MGLRAAAFALSDGGNGAVQSDFLSSPENLIVSIWGAGRVDGELKI
jgi:hypothetical protein